MGIEHEYMEHLFKVVQSLRAGEVYGTPYGPTPDSFRGGSPNQKLLLGAVSYCDAVVIQGDPGISLPKARALVQTLIQFQKKAHCLVGKAWEPLTPSHGQLWWAGWLAILALAVHAGDEEIEEGGVAWVRAEAALCHLSGVESPTGNYTVVTPGARGARPGKAGLAINPARDLGYDMLVTGKMPKPTNKKWQNRYFVGPLFLSWLNSRYPDTFQKLRAPGDGTFLAGPGEVQIWTEADLPEMKNALHVQRTGDQHVSFFPVLQALDPQWGAALLGGEPQFWYWEPGLGPKTGGPNPYKIPRISDPDYRIVVGPGGVP
ncbi:MAG TPA: hypothetical protein VMW27_24050 [Thermoanaerobaculia bacterium]|nr:hypothetical protein [Thermoanaerobaculia bacterium]